MTTTPDTITAYRESLVLHLRLQEVPPDRIGEIAGLTLEPNTDGPVRNAINQGLTSARHIRLGL